MSVINCMLRDLDARAASERERAGLPPHLRPLPPSPRKSCNPLAHVMLGAGVALGAIGFAAWWWELPLRIEPGRLAMAPPPASPGAASEILPPLVVSLQPPQGQEDPAASEEANDTRRGGGMTTMPTLKSASTLSMRASPPQTMAKVDTFSATDARQPSSQTAQQLASPAEPEQKSGPQALASAKITHELRSGAEGLVSRGLEFLRRGELASAEENLRRALAMEPSHAAARQGLLAILAQRQAWAEARQIAEEGLMHDAKRIEWALIAARLHYEAGELETALATLERHAPHAAASSDYQGFLALLYERVGKPRDAVERYRQAVALRPQEGRWWYGLGRTLEATGDAVAAKEAYRQALATQRLPAELAASAESKLRQ
ncbi:MAG: tetratricopeptide repeat protein [Rhodocyclaceae bacterium]|nr:tetratricopeptide repeat protein [Rhodocyclaceae bacterium]